ncbi:MAG: hypothetical protein R3B90_16540 [Planctomycetaceae bacterium]
MIPEFALRLIVGLSLLWCLLPRRQITSGFFRIQMLLTLGLSVLTTLTAGHWFEGTGRSAGHELVPPDGIRLRIELGVLALISFAGSVMWTLERRRAGTLLATLLLVASSCVLLQVSAAPATGSLARWPGFPAALASGAVIGGLVGAMLLGHWYLTATGMPLAPLQRATRLALLAIIIRLIGVVLLTYLAEPEARTALWHEHRVWLLLRWTAGLLGPLLLVGITPAILRYRNTQSATGVLFAAVILVFIGESAALLIARELGQPM